MTAVFFSMPLVGKRSADQWDDVQSRLGETLRSISGSEDPDWRVVITGHERPEIPEIEDDRVSFIAATFSKPAGPAEFTRDKGRKQRSNLDFIAKQGAGYVVMADADDLFSNQLVRFIRQRADPNGYIVRRGYVFSLATGHLAPIPGAWSRSFDAICGSSAVLRLTPEDILGGYVSTLGSHNRIYDSAAAAGRPLYEIEWPAVIYMLGVRETVSILVNRTPERQEQLRQIIVDRSVAITPEIKNEFLLAIS